MLSLTEELTLLAQGGWVQPSLALGSCGSGTPTWWGCMWVSLSSFVAQVSLLRHRGEGKLPILWCDVFQERSRLGERDGQERSEQTDGGIFTPVQTWNIAARVSKCQRSKSAGQSARGEGDHVWSGAGSGWFLSLSLFLSLFFSHTPQRAHTHTHTHTHTLLLQNGEFKNIKIEIRFKCGL